jgi:hypothetical protein
MKLGIKSLMKKGISNLLDPVEKDDNFISANAYFIEDKEIEDRKKSFREGIKKLIGKGSSDAKGGIMNLLKKMNPVKNVSEGDEKDKIKIITDQKEKAKIDHNKEIIKPKVLKSLATTHYEQTRLKCGDLLNFSKENNQIDHHKEIIKPKVIKRSATTH